ncbi:MAG: DUF177 domain-containing protein [Parvibaculaceae bacterium]|nr:DUF177 domain-containing protein [Parvibaculaceae bacterium]
MSDTPKETSEPIVVDESFSQIVELDSVPPTGRNLVFEADETQKVALADRFRIDQVHSLKVTGLLKPWRKAGFKLTAQFEAEVSQTCVVTLELFTQAVKGSFTETFLPEAALEKTGVEIELDAEGIDPPEGFGLERRLDVGRYAAEYFGLKLAPYPRAPGVEFADVIEDSDEKAAENGGDDVGSWPNPFAVLKKLQSNDD